MAVYKIISASGNLKTINGVYPTFMAAKSNLHRMYNTQMWSGDICSWVNNISYSGIVNGINTTTYIKKFASI